MSGAGFPGFPHRQRGGDDPIPPPRIPGRRPGVAQTIATLILAAAVVYGGYFWFIRRVVVGPNEVLVLMKKDGARTLPDNLQPELARKLRFAGWELDVASRNLTSPAGVVVALSGVEHKLLRVFLDHPNRVLTREQLMDLTQSREAYPFDRSIDVQVSRLRNRLGDDAKEPAIIKTVRGEGYVLAAGVEVEK